MSIYSDITCLLKLPNNFLRKFLHQCVDELLGKTDENFSSSMGDIEWSSEELKQARMLVQHMFKSNVFKDELTYDLSALPEGHSDEIRRCFALRKRDMNHVVVQEQLLQAGIPLVENIDWKLRWVMGSSKLASHSEPLLQIDLNCVKNDELIKFELNLSQLDDFIRKLEDVKAKLQSNSI